MSKPKQKVELTYLPCLSLDGLSESKPDGPYHVMIEEGTFYEKLKENVQRIVIEEYRKLLIDFEEIRQEYDVDGPQDIVLVKEYGEFNYKFILYSPGVTCLTIQQVKTILEELRKINNFFLSNK